MGTCVAYAEYIFNLFVFCNVSYRRRCKNDYSVDVLAKKHYFVYFVFLYVNIKRVYVNQNSTAFIHYLYNYDLNTLMLGVFGVLIKWTVVTTTARVLNTVHILI